MLVAAAVAGYAELTPPGPAYRLASVTTADVTATLAEVGTLTPVQQASVPFSVSGTVATVAVRPGQNVTAGQTLGTLDTAPFQTSLTAAQSALANAKLRVADDIASQNAALTGASSGPAAPSGPNDPSGPADPEGSSALPGLQQAVVNGQHAVDTAMATATTDLAQVTQVCAPQAQNPAGSAPAASPSPSASPSPPTCASAEQQTLSDEAAVSHAQQALASQLTALAAALSQLASSAGAGNSGADGSGPAGSGAGAPVSAQQLAADTERADAAADEVTAAQRNLAAATAVSPISGTVVSVSAVPGADEGSGSTAFQVAGLQSWQVVAQVPVAQMPQVAVGEQASVVPDGSTTPVSGTVVTLGLMPAPDSNPVTYPVTIGLDGQPSGLHDGGYAGVTITTAHGDGVSVPTSAVHYSGSRATVTVYSAGRVRVVPVTVGARGPALTRITSGLAPREQVVLANLNAPLPSSNPNTGPFPGRRRIVVIGPVPGR